MAELRAGLDIAGCLVLLVALWHWAVAWRANGGFVWRTFAAMLFMAVRSSRKRATLGAAVVVPIVLTINAVGGLDVVPPVPLGLVVACWVLAVTLLGMPPGLLLLGTSVPEHRSFYEQVMAVSRPLRLVHLLNAEALEATRGSRLEFASLRVAGGRSWFTVVDTLVDLVPVVVLDIRRLTPAVVRELRRVLGSDELRRKTVIVGTGPEVFELADLAQYVDTPMPEWLLTPDTALANIGTLCEEMRRRRGRPFPAPPQPPEAGVAPPRTECSWRVSDLGLAHGSADYLPDSDVVSPETRGVACLVRTRRGTTVFSQGETGPVYERVAALRLGDPQVVAYAGWAVGRWSVHHGDRAYGPFMEVGVTSPVLSPDGRRVAFTARRPGGWFAFVDGEEIGGPYEGFGLGGVVFSPDSRRTIYVVKEHDRWRTVVDGIAQERFVTIQQRTQRFSPDSDTVVYVAMLRGRFVGCAFVGEGGVVVDGEVLRTWPVDDRERASGIGSEVYFSPDARRMAYWVKTGSTVRVVVDGEPQLRGLGVVSGWQGSSRQRFMLHANAGWSNGAVAFSPDGRHVAYALRRKGRDRLVLDGTEIADHDTFLNRPVVFSPDSRRLAYGVAVGRGNAMVVDGVEGRSHGTFPVVPFTFSRDSKHSAFVIPGRTGDWLRVDDESVPVGRYVLEGAAPVWGDRGECRVACRYPGFPAGIVELGRSPATA